MVTSFNACEIRLFWFSRERDIRPTKADTRDRWWRMGRQKRKWLIFKVHECGKTGNCRRTGYWGDFSDYSLLFSGRRGERDANIQRIASFFREKRRRDGRQNEGERVVRSKIKDRLVWWSTCPIYVCVCVCALLFLSDHYRWLCVIYL